MNESTPPNTQPVPLSAEPKLSNRTIPIEDVDEAVTSAALRQMLREANERADKARQEAQELREAQRWIPVEGQLPPKGRTVLIWREGIPVGPILAFWTGEKWCNDVMKDSYVVTHWMHRPEPPATLSPTEAKEGDR